ncbi:MAG: hypothetical protein H3Z50_03960 [archaeon]|nr:hypothetical protein [archaeon]MCP8306582.1 hypothetical protein [archaeon]
MVELYKIGSDGQILEIKREPISEKAAVAELRNFIMANERILGNVALLDNNIETSDGTQGHVWGLDMLDLRPVIVELRNMITGIEAIPQILPYFAFVKSNPDAMKFRISSNVKLMQKLEGFEVDLDKLNKGLEEDPKVILVAPAFKKELLDVVNYVKFGVKLVEISRYKTEDGGVVVVINRPEIPVPSSATFRVMGAWAYPSIERPHDESEMPHEEIIESEEPREIAQPTPISSRVFNYLFGD